MKGEFYICDRCNKKVVPRSEGGSIVDRKDITRIIKKSQDNDSTYDLTYEFCNECIEDFTMFLNPELAHSLGRKYNFSGKGAVK